ncbi:MAG: hypothetical protein LBB28_00200, partial [Synergistaceae bacterium]|nr:hypothetical protein [Synergistaceae bacterium]
MTVWNNKIILSGFAAAVFIFVTTPSAPLSAAEGMPGRDALDIAASLPNNRPANIIRPLAEGDIGEAALSTVSSVKGIVKLMMQAQEISAMLPSRRITALPSPKTDTEIALDVASRLPAIPVTAASKPADTKPTLQAPKTKAPASEPPVSDP